MLLKALLAYFQTSPAVHVLPSVNRRQNLFDDILQLSGSINSTFDPNRVRPLLVAVIQRQPDQALWNAIRTAVTETTPPPRRTSSFRHTPLSMNTGSIANSAERRIHVDKELKIELENIYTDVPGFSETFFEDVQGLEPAAQAVFDKCMEGDSPLFGVESGWQGWPEGAQESKVLNWLVSLTDRLVNLAEGYQPMSATPRRLRAEPNQPLQGSTADRKLDISFVDVDDGGNNRALQWSDILIPGELKSNPTADRSPNTWLDLGRYARESLAAQDNRRFVHGFTLCGSLMRLWLFDRLGAIASEHFDVNKDGLQFVSTVLGFLWMSKEQLGFDPTIIIDGDKRYIEIERENGKERLIIERVVQRVRYVAGRATTCWVAHKDGDPKTPLVIKDSWQYPEREEEGELLREAAKAQVVNVARYYYHETVRVGAKDDTVCGNVRRGLDVTKGIRYRPGRKTSRPSTAVPSFTASRKGSSSSVARQKRPSGQTNAAAPASKRTCSSSLAQEQTTPVDRVHRRLIVQDFGKPIYKASSRDSLLAGMIGCINGYESLYQNANMLQCDISPNNLMVNEDDNNPSLPAFLIDLDLAIKTDREKSSGARGKTGTRAFIAVGILIHDEPRSFMHDLESFFWVLFWICIHYDGQTPRVVPEFDRWNYLEMPLLGTIKIGIGGHEDVFEHYAKEHFTEYYKPLMKHVDRLRAKLFPGNNNWSVENPNLFSEMRDILQTARDELKNEETS
ncbi:hypothetical protein CFE70_004998 [Pyrenophora teres f. teres 0-1]